MASLKPTELILPAASLDYGRDPNMYHPSTKSSLCSWRNNRDPSWTRTASQPSGDQGFHHSVWNCSCRWCQAVTFPQDLLTALERCTRATKGLHHTWVSFWAWHKVRHQDQCIHTYTGSCSWAWAWVTQDHFWKRSASFKMGFNFVTWLLGSSQTHVLALFHALEIPTKNFKMH